MLCGARAFRSHSSCFPRAMRRRRAHSGTPSSSWQPWVPSSCRSPTGPTDHPARVRSRCCATSSSAPPCIHSRISPASVHRTWRPTAWCGSSSTPELRVSSPFAVTLLAVRSRATIFSATSGVPPSSCNSFTGCRPSEPSTRLFRREVPPVGARSRRPARRYGWRSPHSPMGIRVRSGRTRTSTLFSPSRSPARQWRSPNCSSMLRTTSDSSMRPTPPGSRSPSCPD